MSILATAALLHFQTLRRIGEVIPTLFAVRIKDSAALLALVIAVAALLDVL
jgi:hypothetical protein